MYLHYLVKHRGRATIELLQKETTARHDEKTSVGREKVLSEGNNCLLYLLVEPFF